MFGICSSLTAVGLSKIKTRDITSMIMMFNGCTNLTSINLGDIDTSKK